MRKFALLIILIILLPLSMGYSISENAFERDVVFKGLPSPIRNESIALLLELENKTQEINTRSFELQTILKNVTDSCNSKDGCSEKELYESFPVENSFLQDAESLLKKSKNYLNQQRYLLRINQSYGQNYAAFLDYYLEPSIAELESKIDNYRLQQDNLNLVINKAIENKRAQDSLNISIMSLESALGSLFFSVLVFSVSTLLILIGYLSKRYGEKLSRLYVCLLIASVPILQLLHLLMPTIHLAIITFISVILVALFAFIFTRYDIWFNRTKKIRILIFIIVLVISILSLILSFVRYYRDTSYIINILFGIVLYLILYFLLLGITLWLLELPIIEAIRKKWFYHNSFTVDIFFQMFLRSHQEIDSTLHRTTFQWIKTASKELFTWKEMLKKEVLQGGRRLRKKQEEIKKLKSLAELFNTNINFVLSFNLPNEEEQYFKGLAEKMNILLPKKEGSLVKEFPWNVELNYLQSPKGEGLTEIIKHESH